MKRHLRSFFLRLARRRDLDRDLEDELAHHLEMRRANSPARAPFGNVTAIREDCRGVWTLPLEDWCREIRLATRILRRAPAHSAAIVILLALGIGANVAMFSLVNAIFLRELPVPEPDRLVAISPGFSTPLFEEFRSMQSSFTGIFGTGSLLGTVVTTEAGEPIPNASGGIASGNYFEVLGVHAARGRVFTPDDDRPADPRAVMVISHAFWQKQFGGAPDLPGRRLHLAGTPFTIIGVTPKDFAGEMPGRKRDYWVPLNMQPVANPQGDLRRNPGYPWLSAMGRLKPGVSLQQAQAEAAVVYHQLVPRSRNVASPLRLEPGGRGFGGFRRQYGTQLQILAGLVAIILLVVCANVATLLLARGTARRREMAVRLALGCGRARLARQLFIEGLLLAVVGAALGIALAPAGAQALLMVQPGFSPVVLDLWPDTNVMLFACAISLLAVLLFSVAPALRASRVAIEPELKSGSRGSSAPSRQRLIHGVIAIQTALSVILVASSFLFARSLSQLRSVETGYDRHHIISATVNARLAGYREDADHARLGDRLVERLSTVPGVKSASVALCAVLMGCSRMGVLRFEGREPRPGEPAVWISPVSSNYFETAGIPILQGRGFGPQDGPGSPRVAVVTESLARHYFPGDDPIGKRFTEHSSADAVEIIGVTRDVIFVSPRDAPIRMVFLSLRQFPGPFSYVQVRTDGPPARLLSAVRHAMLEVDSKLFILGPDPLDRVLNGILARDLMLSRASALFGFIALVLACFGIYGVISYMVAARRAELGIRLAIGARPGAVLAHVLLDAIKAVTPGILVGIAAAWAAGRMIESLLFGVTPNDPLTYLGVAAALLLTTTLAAYLPGRRASRIDPVTALRCD